MCETFDIKILIYRTFDKSNFTHIKLLVCRTFDMSNFSRTKLLNIEISIYHNFLHQTFDISNFPISRFRYIELPTYRTFDISNFRYIVGIERIFARTPWHPRIFHADTEQKVWAYRVPVTAVSTIHIGNRIDFILGLSISYRTRFLFFSISIVTLVEPPFLYIVRSDAKQPREWVRSYQASTRTSVQQCEYHHAARASHSSLHWFTPRAGHTDHIFPHFMV